jgi:hypothetical protein
MIKQKGDLGIGLLANISEIIIYLNYNRIKMIEIDNMQASIRNFPHN